MMSTHTFFKKSMVRTACTLLFLAFAATGCSDDDQDVDLGISPDTAGSVQVFLGADMVDVDLGPLETLEYKDVDVTPLSAVWSQAFPSVDPSTLVFGFESDDGFKPSNKGCEDVSGTALSQGYLERTSRNLVWDESLGFRGCYSVRGTKSIFAREPDDANEPEDISGLAGSVQVFLGADMVDVDLGPLETLEYNDVDVTPLSAVWSQAFPSVDPTALVFGFESDDGFKPSNKGCEDVSGTALSQGYLEKISRNLVWEESLGFKGCYSVQGTKSIVAREPDDADTPEATD